MLSAFTALAAGKPHLKKKKLMILLFDLEGMFYLSESYHGLSTLNSSPQNSLLRLY